MLTPEDRAAVAAQTRILRIIVLALMAGPLVFLAFVLTQQPDGEPRPAGNLAQIAAGMAAVQAVLAVVVPKIIEQRHRQAIVEGRSIGANIPAQTSDARGLLAGLQVRRIIAAALLEGAAFFNIVAYQTERASYSLAIAAALIGGVALLFPWRSFVEDWLDRELRTVTELRTLQR